MFNRLACDVEKKPQKQMHDMDWQGNRLVVFKKTLSIVKQWFICLPRTLSSLATCLGWLASSHASQHPGSNCRRWFHRLQTCDGHKNNCYTSGTPSLIIERMQPDLKYVSQTCMWCWKNAPKTDAWHGLARQQVGDLQKNTFYSQTMIHLFA